MKYFNLFYMLAKSYDITIICYFPPKSIYWQKGIKVLELDTIWNTIKDSLFQKDLIMLDLENYFGEECRAHVEIKNHSNQLLIFPAHLTHGVTINKSDFTRITVAFNIILDDSIKETDLKKS